MKKKLGSILILIFLLGQGVVMGTDNRDICDTPFGVLDFLHWNHNWNNFHYPDTDSRLLSVDKMVEAGVSIVRLDFVWQEIEPQEGIWNFQLYDELVEMLVRRNIQILGLLDYSADWASSCGRWNCPPKDNLLFVQFAQKVVNRYKDRIRYWEIWNEPDSNVYWQPQDGLVKYVGLLKDVYCAIKQEDPNCFVLNGGLANGLASVNRLYDAGAAGYFDIMNVHLFESPLDPLALKRAQAFLERVHKIMQRNKDGHKKIWITELGAPGVRRGLRVDNWWLGKNPNEHQQAQWVRLVFTKLLDIKYVEKIFWAFWRDTNGHWKNGIDYFGLLRNDFSVKESFIAYKEASRQWRLKLNK
ncbi:MAG: beta-galactosidase [Candidatus Omnitrophica bacterium]|nr:beta-galactosidase [Candidatus Omnitrophota bacterium]